MPKTNLKTTVMNIAVIFAGGSGSRMTNASKPKQFLEFNGKPIIIYTLEHFQNHPEIDAIITVCIEPWIPYMKSLAETYKITKIASIVPGGETGQDSIWNGINEAHRLFPEDSAVLIHDGVRPLINSQVITDNIRTTQEKGNCITSVKAIETLLIDNNDGTTHIPPRKDSFIARAPQTFILKDIHAAHSRAREEGRHDFIDSCTLMHHYGHELNRIIGPMENIKITTPSDYFMFRALILARAGEQIFGL